MLSYEVRRSVTVSKNQADVLKYLADFRAWPEWSPWLIQEPGCKLNYSDNQGEVGAGDDWDGEMVGAGKMELTAKTENHLAMDLKFLRPFKSQADISFELAGTVNETTVTWVMNSKVPWFLFFLKGMMKVWIGMDYERGLKMLKNKLETGHVHSKVRIIGERPWDETHYVALEGKAAIKDLGPIWSDYMEKLGNLIKEKGLETTGPVIGFYQSMDMKTTINEFRACIPVAGPVDVEAPFIYDTIKACDTYVIEHVGDYQYLGNAWATAMTASRVNKVKVKRKPMGMEVYRNDPHTTEPKDLITEIVLFKK